jgi:hypothetical protein
MLISIAPHFIERSLGRCYGFLLRGRLSWRPLTVGSLALRLPLRADDPAAKKDFARFGAENGLVLRKPARNVRTVPPLSR